MNSVSDPIMDALHTATTARHAAPTPLDKVKADIVISYCQWALVHDITERVFGDPDWFRLPNEYREFIGLD